MKMTSVQSLVPLARYLLIALSTYLVHTGLLSMEMAEQVKNDPAVLELVGGGLLGLITVFWWFVSASRKALMDRLTK